ncbi:MULTISPECIES: Crp/Fnr family transcriptional regulator [Methylobacterium]|uniref:Crp/Fnr family transcriptional regulator n=1 Tax=Methylobacterium TaxID=407 RepID=UPI00104842F0|nr:MULTISPECIES: Crp/Fnr family transcriptional regulator [Methylobacterium]MDR7035898.1 CRP-like cAMP-binding protein [Methylobacterium sp. BE186]
MSENSIRVRIPESNAAFLNGSGLVSPLEAQSLSPRSVPAGCNPLLDGLLAEAPVGWADELELVSLTPGETLFPAGASPTHIVFPMGGLISLLVRSGPAANAEVEVAMVGRHDLVGAAALLGAEPSAHRAVVQVGAPGYRASAASVRRLIETVPAIRSLLLRYVRMSLEEAYQLAACNSRHSLEKRLCRWLLQAHQRLESDTLPFTHDHIAQMLGVRRASVTVALHIIEGERLIRSTRGRVDLLDRTRLQMAACECCGAIAQNRRAFSFGPAAEGVERATPACATC